MSERADEDFVLDVLEAIHRVVSYTQSMTQDQFMEDLRTQDAVVRNLEIIGEAANRISDDFRKIHSRIPWRGMSGMRNRLIHHYFGVNLDIVWDIVRIELPALEIQLRDIIAERST